MSRYNAALHYICKPMVYLLFICPNIKLLVYNVNYTGLSYFHLSSYDSIGTAGELC